MPRFLTSKRLILAVPAALLTLLGAPACGGGGGGDGNPTGSMALINFDQAGVQNLALNQVLRFLFSESVDPQSLTAASVQMREGPDFGATVNGTFRISGAVVFFEPQLPGNCDLTDAGFKADTQYRVTLVGSPEAFALRRDDGNPGSATGDPLKGTLNFEFHTRAADDPLLFTDQIAATPPVVTATTPVDGTAAVQVFQGNQITIEISENLSPCSVNDTTVLVHEFQRGDAAIFTVDPVSGRNTGFTPTADSDLADKFSWGPIAGGESSVAPPQRIRASIGLVQSFTGTRITITPEFGQFPDNALVVVQLTFGIRDFGGNALVPHVFAFTTENLPLQNGVYNVKFEGETPIIIEQSTADVNTVRSPLVAQGWLLFSGDADNGSNLFSPTLPANNPPSCNIPRQVNDGIKDNLDVNNADIVLDTGASINLCANKTDGSTAVVWEYQTFRIRNGRTLRIRGVNPAIILVQGNVNIDLGGRLLVKGDGNGGFPTANGAQTSNPAVLNPGGAGSSGGGNGGRGYGPWYAGPALKGDSGSTGFGSPSPYSTVGGTGAGGGGPTATMASFAANHGCGYGGGGGGHSSVGMDGSQLPNATMTYLTTAVPVGGGVYPAMDNKLLTPSAGSGGGAGGAGYNPSSQQAGANYCGGGGSGGAGGGFCDLTSSGNITIFGQIDASGGRGGGGGTGFYSTGGGGGGGSGGGIRILTPNVINLTGATITAAGGQAGAGAVTGATGAGNAGGGPPNPGGAGGLGRVVLEDGDSLMTGIGSAIITPPEGDPSNGFYRGVFDPSRFKGGGLEPTVVTAIFQVGPNNPTFTIPVQADFIASIPTGADRGLNNTSCMIEAQGFQMLADGTVDNVTPPTGWKTVGYFKHSGVASLPTWTANAIPPDVIMPADNTGPGITALNGSEFIQLRITFYLPTTIGPFDPGPILDNWTIRFSFDQ